VVHEGQVRRPVAGRRRQARAERARDALPGLGSRRERDAGPGPALHPPGPGRLRPDLRRRGHRGGGTGGRRGRGTPGRRQRRLRVGAARLAAGRALDGARPAPRDDRRLARARLGGRRGARRHDQHEQGARRVPGRVRGTEPRPRRAAAHERVGTAGLAGTRRHAWLPVGPHAPASRQEHHRRHHVPRRRRGRRAAGRRLRRQRHLRSVAGGGGRDRSLPARAPRLLRRPRAPAAHSIWRSRRRTARPSRCGPARPAGAARTSASPRPCCGPGT
jgi:hypothetical protein